MKRLLVGLVMLLAFTPTLAAARCLQYEPTVLLLKGTFIKKSLPGPPGYTSIARGDLPEDVLFLQLDEPICVKGNPESTFNARTHTGITEVQLVVPVGQFLDLLGKRVRVYGSLFASSMRTHRTKVAMTVESISALPDDD